MAKQGRVEGLGLRVNVCWLLGSRVQGLGGL